MSALLRGLCWFAGALCCGCIPVPIITADRPTEITPHVSTELTAPSLDVMLVPITARGGEAPRGVLTLDEPIFAKASDIIAFEEKLERTSLHAVILFFPGGLGAGTVSSNKVQEVCLIGSNGKTMTLARTDKGWSPSEVVALDPSWKNQFIALLAESRPATLLPIWKSAPCGSFDWAALELKWQDEHRRRAIEFLRRLPSQ